jgi:hypothetical protein
MYHVKHCCTAAEHFVRERDAFINISDGFAPLWSQLNVWHFVDFGAKIPDAWALSETRGTDWRSPQRLSDGRLRRSA